MRSHQGVRRFIFGVTALVFFVIAIASVFWPQVMADPLGYQLSNTNALSEFRAIYVGLWLVHVLFFIYAAKNIDNVLIGDVCGLLILGQVVGRAISLAIDGLPTYDLWPTAIVELVGAALIFATRTGTAVIKK